MSENENMRRAARAFDEVTWLLRQALSDRRQRRAGTPPVPYPDRLVGVEVEFTGDNDDGHPTEMSMPSMPDGVRVHEDGSCGWEAVTPPLGSRTARFDRVVRGVCETVTGLDDRCGLHVHVDARDLTYPDVRRLVAAWGHVEEACFAIGGYHRRDSHYCRSLPRARAQELASLGPSQISAGFRAWFENEPGSFRDVREARHIMGQPTGQVHKKCLGRYRALNLVPWLAGRRRCPVLGDRWSEPDTTIEFRGHEGTHTTSRIVSWARLCADIVTFAATVSDGEVSALPRSPWQALATISPQSTPYLVERIRAHVRVASRERARAGSSRCYVVGNGISGVPIRIMPADPIRVGSIRVGRRVA